MAENTELSELIGGARRIVTSRGDGTIRRELTDIIAAGASGLSAVDGVVVGIKKGGTLNLNYRRAKAFGSGRMGEGDFLAASASDLAKQVVPLRLGLLEKGGQPLSAVTILAGTGVAAEWARGVLRWRLAGMSGWWSSFLSLVSVWELGLRGEDRLVAYFPDAHFFDREKNQGKSAGSRITRVETTLPFSWSVVAALFLLGRLGADTGGIFKTETAEEFEIPDWPGSPYLQVDGDSVMADDGKGFLSIRLLKSPRVWVTALTT